MSGRTRKYDLSVAAVLVALSVALALAVLTGYRYELYSLEAGFFILTGLLATAFFLAFIIVEQNRPNKLPVGTERSSLADFQNAIYKSSIVSRADKAGNITFVNENFVAISGYSSDELIGHNHRLINSGFHPRSFWINMWKTIASGKIWRADVRNQAKDGSFYWVDTFIMPFLNADGSVREFLSIRNDITERKRNEEEIKKLSLVASKTSNAVTITDAAGAVEWVNDSFVKITGYTFDEVKGKNMRLLQGPESDPVVVKRIRNRLSQGNSVSEELFNYARDGRKFWVKLDITPIFDADRSLRNFVSVHSDITRIKEYETSVSAIARELASLIENANVPIFGINGQGRITDWNKVAADIFGYERHHAIGSMLKTRIFEESWGDEFERIVREVMGGASLANLECAVVTQGGKRLVLLMSASPRRDSDGAITGVIFVAQNITELIDYRQSLEVKVAERTQALHEALQKERTLVEMKSRFVSIASHEFRTPLSTISVATALIRKHYTKLSPDELDQKLANIQKQVEYMAVMLDDVLMIEKASAGKLEVQQREIMLDEFFTNLCEEVERSKGGTHHIRIIKSLDIDRVNSDDKLWRSIFINLLTNAIKFSPGVALVDIAINSNRSNVSVTVKDYGIGIPEQDVRNLFEPFFRGGNVHAIQGTGLGLSIIRKSLDLLHGTITVNSIPGKATEFHVTIPVRP